LKDHELARVTVNKKQAPLSPIGVTWERRYTLVEPFAIRSGKKPQETARKGVRRGGMKSRSSSAVKGK
jgi:hypothetical protein